jgi:hypothetical protein
VVLPARSSAASLEGATNDAAPEDNAPRTAQHRREVNGPSVGNALGAAIAAKTQSLLRTSAVHRRHRVRTYDAGCSGEAIQQEGLGNEELAKRWRGEPIVVR